MLPWPIAERSNRQDRGMTLSEVAGETARQSDRAITRAFTDPDLE
jgi:hypothetical protein